MDISETYIKMCEKAEEIQGLWQSTNGDFCWHGNEGEEAFGNWEFPAQASTVHISQETEKAWWYNWLWLPRQDQLQEMVEPSGLSDYLLYLFWSFLTTDKDEYALNAYAHSFTSMEQLWLAFVMKEKYGKVWNGKDWELSR